jgi:multidrug efflux system membrane fusion protein
VKAAGTHSHIAWAKFASIAIIAAAAAVGLYAQRRSTTRPASDDATIDADVVHIAAEVGGRIVEIPVEENRHVARGDLLFQIDPLPYQLAVDQAQANLDIAIAALDTRRRVLSTQRSTAVVAADQSQSARAKLDLAARTVQRLDPLATKGYVPDQQLDQARTTQHDAFIALRQAQEQQAAAVRAIDTDAAELATVEARKAELALARRHLADTSVRATHAGRVVGLTALSGEMVAPSQSLFTLVSDEAWFSTANFRETDLHAIGVGDCVTVYSMIDRTRAIRGVVQGIGLGVLDTDRVDLPRSVPYVQRSLDWVRVAQRFPVRIRLIDPPPDLVRLGASAVVEVRRGDSCR